MITIQTRQLSFEDIKPKRKIRYEQILERLATGKKTAKQIAVELFDLGLTMTKDRNNASPRLTELEEMGLVKVVEKTKCEYTGKSVAVYEITLDGLNKVYFK